MSIPDAVQFGTNGVECSDFLHTRDILRVPANTLILRTIKVPCLTESFP